MPIPAGILLKSPRKLQLLLHTPDHTHIPDSQLLKSHSHFGVWMMELWVGSARCFTDRATASTCTHTQSHIPCLNATPVSVTNTHAHPCSGTSGGYCSIWMMVLWVGSARCSTRRVMGPLPVRAEARKQPTKLTLQGICEQRQTKRIMSAGTFTDHCSAIIEKPGSSPQS
jgi:hypothetical protein